MDLAFVKSCWPTRLVRVQVRVRGNGIRRTNRESAKQRGCAFFVVIGSGMADAVLLFSPLTGVHAESSNFAGSQGFDLKATDF